MKTVKIFKILTSLSLLSFISCTNLEQSEALKVQTHSAGESGFLVNSHLITGRSEAILVDAQFTQSESAKVVEMIKKSGKSLTTIYITHGHPDHYFGLDLIQKAFPSARIIAKEGVIETIKATAQGKFDYWKPLYGNDLTDKIIVPEVFNGEELELDGQKIEILTFHEGESAHDTSLYIPSIKALISGDVLYNKVHNWLVEHHEGEWLENLKELEKLEITTTYPGHGPASDKSLIQKNLEYIESFKSQEGRSYEEALLNMKSLYPDFKLPIILELSLK
jgi:glyoxylase-like metal-dependent hydrolase (beta-lactamase superfamily II)